MSIPHPQPVMDGPTATRAIRALGVDWLVFGVTGNGLASDQKTFLEAGANQVVIKPLYLADFEKAMVSHLARGAERMKTSQTDGSLG